MTPVQLMLLGSLLLSAPSAAAAAAPGSDAGSDAAVPPDGLHEALERMGISTELLGHRPMAHWARYPHARNVPYVLPFFEDLLAHPLDTYEFTRTLANAVEDGLTPESLTTPPDADNRRETLYKLAVALATDRRIGGFRGYSANLAPTPAEEAPLFHALSLLRERAGSPLRHPSRTFGGAYDAGDEDPVMMLREQVAAVPAALRLPLARYVLNLVEAREWVESGLRRVPAHLREAVFASLPSLTEEMPDGLTYVPAIDDVARLVDEHSLWYGCLKALQATQDARRELGAAWQGDSSHRFRLRLESPWGDIIFDSRAGEDARSQPAFLLVSLGDHSLSGPLGATTARQPLSVALLLDESGNVGTGAKLDLRQEGPVGHLASGVLGCGIVYAAGDRPNAWRTGRSGLGAGLFGLGALVDEGGDDSYSLVATGQGAGLFGAGLLLDAAGRDTYELLEGDGQGYGGPGGIGLLADRQGDDRYYAEPDAALAGRADYHSDNKIAASHAQGVGSGRRGDGGDGHVWAGGLGALLDVEGDDRYRAGNFSQGLGYWYGTGLLWDGAGDDIYRSVYFTQGSGAHFAIGALIDEGGDDTHLLEETAGAAFGFGWDVVNALLLDWGDGNDRYEARRLCFGLAEVRSHALFIDEGGDDSYLLDAGAKGLGDVDERDSYTSPERTRSYLYHLPQTGIFLDLDGRDRYLRREAKADIIEEDPEAADGRVWNLKRRAPEARWGPNLSFGGDFEGASLGFLEPWPARQPVTAASR